MIEKWIPVILLARCRESHSRRHSVRSVVHNSDRFWSVDLTRAVLSSMRTWIAALFCLASSSCLSSYSAHVEHLRSRFIGLEARTLRDCLPVPEDVRSLPELERLTYRWVIPPDAEQSSPSSIWSWQERRQQRLGTAHSPRAQAEDGARDRRSGREAIGSEAFEPNHCELVFELREGRVTAVETGSRRSPGADRNADCLLITERCLAKSLASR